MAGSTLREELERIFTERGELDPKVVMAAAGDAERYPAIHSQLEWDDKVAGEKYRLQQCHELIRKVKFVYRDAADDPVEIRYWHAVRTPDGFKYYPAPDIASSPVLSSIMLMDMRREWRSLQLRYGHFKEFIDMVQSDIA